MTIRFKASAWGLPAALIATAASFPATAGEAVHFAPHRAVYELSMADSTAGSGVSGVSGRMVYELNGSLCDGYTQNMRFVTIMTNQEGTETVSDLRNSSWEEADGKKLRFSSTQYQNDELADASQGDAARTKGSTPIVGVDLIKPKRIFLVLRIVADIGELIYSATQPDRVFG